MLEPDEFDCIIHNMNQSVARTTSSVTFIAYRALTQQQWILTDQHGECATCDKHVSFVYP